VSYLERRGHTYPTPQTGEITYCGFGTPQLHPGATEGQMYCCTKPSSTKHPVSLSCSMHWSASLIHWHFSKYKNGHFDHKYQVLQDLSTCVIRSSTGTNDPVDCAVLAGLDHIG
jgi:hypothetical protein